MTAFLLRLATLTLTMSAVIALALLGGRLFGHRVSAEGRYAVWTVILLSLSLGLALFRLPAAVTVDLPLPAPVSAPTEITPAPGSAETAPLELETAPSVDRSPTVIPTTPSVTASRPVPTPRLDLDPAVILFAVWAVGAAAFLCVSLAVYLRTTRKYARSKRLPSPETEAIFDAICRRHGLRRPPRLYVCPAVGSPLLYGYFTPTILLPDLALGQNALVAVLGHELTHHRRRDLEVKLVCLVAESLYWFNPLVHLAAARCNAEMELSCDEALLAGTSSEARRAYGNIMLEIVRHCAARPSALTTQFNPRMRAVRARLVSILDGTKKSRGRLALTLVLVLCLVAGTVLGCAVREEASIDEAAYAQAERLTEQLIHFVMQEEWLNGLTACSEENIFAFLASLPRYAVEDEMAHPYARLVSQSPDGRMFSLALGDAQKISAELFGYEAWTAASCPRVLNDLYNEAAACYQFPVEVGGGMSAYSFAEMETTHDGDRITVTCELVESPFYEYAAHDYGRYAFTYRYIPTVEGAYLRYLGVQRQTSDDTVVYRDLVYADLTEFLTAEQVALYRRARRIYPIFNGVPETLDSLSLDFDTSAYRAVPGRPTPTGSRFLDGFYFYPASGEFQSYAGFDALCRTVFTDAYWAELCGETLRELDGHLYYRDTAKGGAFGYNTADYPDQYQLLSRSPTEISFRVIGHYKGSNIYPIYHLTTQSYPVTLTLTDDGWRFSRFSDPALDDTVEYATSTLVFDESVRATMEGETVPVRLGEWLRDADLRVTGYASVDLDRDTTYEQLLRLAIGENEDFGYLILNLERDGEVRAYLLYHRALQELKADGTFFYAGGVANQGVGTMTFADGRYTVTTLAHNEPAPEGQAHFYIGEVRVSHEEFAAYQRAQSEKPSAVWYPFPG